MSGVLTDYELEILDNVEEFGCHVTTVFDPDGKDPSYSYSTGFTKTVEQGEVIVFGLDDSLMHRMVNIVLDQCEDGLLLAEGLRMSGVLEGFDVVARAIPPERIDVDHFNSAMWFHRRTFGTELTRAFQLVWPGAVDGLFPWNDGASDLVCSLQPALYKRETVQ